MHGKFLTCLFIIQLVAAFFSATHSLRYPLQARTTGKSSNHLYKIRTPRGSAYINGQGRIVLQLPGLITRDWKSHIHPFSRGGLEPFCIVKKFPGTARQARKCGYVDRRGRRVIPARYDSARLFSEGLAAVRVGNRWGAVDRSGRLVVPAAYPRPFFFKEGRAGIDFGPAMDHGNPSPGSPDRAREFAFIDKRGKILGPERWDRIGPFREGLAPVWEGSKSGFINRQGRLVISPRFADTMGYREGLARSCLVGPLNLSRCGFIDRTGGWAIAPTFNLAGEFRDGIASARISRGRWGFINRQGKWVIKPMPSFDDYPRFVEGLAYMDGYFIDRGGRVVIRLKQGRARDFSEGLAAINIGTGQLARCEYIDKTGRVVIKRRWGICHSFRGSLAFVDDREYRGENRHYIDRRGRTVRHYLSGSRR